MKYLLPLLLTSIVFLLSCKVSDFKLSAPQITKEQSALKKFDHTKFEKASCVDCHEINRPKTKVVHGDGLNCIECHSPAITKSGKKSWLNLVKFSHNTNIQSCNKCHLTSDRDSRPNPKENHPSAKYNKLDCVLCHQYQSPMNNWKDIKFNQLNHSPAPISCNSCHESIRPTSHTINPKTEGMKTSDCISCHGSNTNWGDNLKVYNHESSQPKSCVNCHKNDAPKPIENHPSAKESYNKIDCIQCHTYTTSNSNNKKSWKNTSFDTKTHKSVNTTTCLECHKNSNNSLPSSGSHNLASRSKLDCNQCHVFATNSNWSNFKSFNHDKTESSETCLSCHNDKSKLLKFKTSTHVPTSLECNACHTTNAWKPATYKHANTDTNCLSCHNGMTASKKPSNHTLTTQAQCSLCHTQDRWSPAWFDKSYLHAANGKLPPQVFRGKITHHKDANKCQSCHDNKSESVKYTTPQYANSCLGCHMQEFSSEYHRGSEANKLKNCLECHTYKSWDK